jgi:hypothetical protein
MTHNIFLDELDHETRNKKLNNFIILKNIIKITLSV